LKIGLFLGAGASVQFGNPTTKKFKEQLIETNAVDKRIRPILNLKSLPDVEYVLECLKEILNIGDSPFGKFLNNEEVDIVMRSEKEITFRELFSLGAGPYNQIMQNLFQTYQIEDEKKPLLKNFFKTLFDLISKYSDAIEVVTTNYDLAVETFCNLPATDYQCVDGFAVSGKGYYWNPELFNQNFDPSRGKFVKLYKIHGSLDWQGTGKQIKKLGSIPNFEPSGATPSTVIAPTLSQKDEYDNEPFSLLLQHFSKKLSDSDVCIVIGFSFRDREISKHFEEYVKNGKHLIIVSPNCHKDYIENLFQTKNVFSNGDIKNFANTHAISKNRRVNLIDSPFEGKNDQKIFEDLENYLK